MVRKVSEYLLYQMYYSERAIWRIWTVCFENQVRAWSGQPQGRKAIYVNTASKKDLIYAKPIWLQMKSLNSFGPTWKCLVLATQKSCWRIWKIFPISVLLLVKTEARVTADLEVRSCRNGMTVYDTNRTALSFLLHSDHAQKSSVLGLWSSGESNHFWGLVHKMWRTCCTERRADS